jgi:hypothetical protein
MEQVQARGCPDKPSSPRATVRLGRKPASCCVPQAPNRRWSWGEFPALQAIRPLTRSGLSGLDACRPTDCSLILPFSLHTHRPHCQLARAPGGSRAHRRFPPRRFVWEILKIDSQHTNQPRQLHSDPELCQARALPPPSCWNRQQRPEAPWRRWTHGRNLTTYPIPEV